MTDWASAMRKGDSLRPVPLYKANAAADMFAVFESGQIGRPCAPTRAQIADQIAPGQHFCVVLTDDGSHR